MLRPVLLALLLDTTQWERPTGAAPGGAAASSSAAVDAEPEAVEEHAGLAAGGRRKARGASLCPAPHPPPLWRLSALCPFLCPSPA